MSSVVYLYFGSKVLAQVNILQGSIIGSIGKITGSVWKGKPTIRAKIFSKSPPQEIQTNNVRAFECLNRISSAISQTGFARLGIASKNLHHHNAVARWLKPAIKNHIFQPANISEVIPYGDNVRVTSFFHNPTTGETNLKVRLAQGFTPPDFSYLFVVVFDDIGRTYFSHCDLLKKCDFDFFIDNPHKQVYSFLIFYTEPLRNKRVAKNFFYKRGNVMQYSLEEQLTGDYWIDGRPIYQKSFNFSFDTRPDRNYQINLGAGSNYTNVIDVKISNLKLTGRSYYKLAGQVATIAISDNTPASISDLTALWAGLRQDSNQFFISSSRTDMGNATGGTVTFFYTLQSDQPVVDG